MYWRKASVRADIYGTALPENLRDIFRSYEPDLYFFDTNNTQNILKNNLSFAHCQVIIKAQRRCIIGSGRVSESGSDSVRLFLVVG